VYYDIGNMDILQEKEMVRIVEESTGRFCIVHEKWLMGEAYCASNYLLVDSAKDFIDVLKTKCDISKITTFIHIQDGSFVINTSHDLDYVIYNKILYTQIQDLLEQENYGLDSRLYNENIIN